MFNELEMHTKQGLGLAIGATLMDLKRATTLASVTVMTFMLAGGFFVKVSTQVFLESLNFVPKFISYKISWLCKKRTIWFSS